MTVEVAQSRTSTRVTTGVVATVLRSLVEIGATIKTFFRGRSESAAVETDGVTAPQIPADAEVEVGAGISSIAHNELSQQEVDRRRSLVRAFFNDFWSGAHDKPAAFAERLDQAENYLNGRLIANGEGWRLDAKTRIMLGLPPRSTD
jgi:hypothetical protein